MKWIRVVKKSKNVESGWEKEQAKARIQALEEFLKLYRFKRGGGQWKPR